MDNFIHSPFYFKIMKNNNKIWLNELTWKDTEDHLKKDDIILFPIGSTEEHGLAGPLGLDSYVAISLAEDVAKKTGVLSTPPLWFGNSSHHMGFAGTISLRLDTLINVVRDVCISLAKHGFKKILIINGHKYSNLPALIGATHELHENELKDVFFAVIDPMKIGATIAKKIKQENEHHAGELEISEIMYKYPDLIKKELLDSENVNMKEIFSDFIADDLFGGGGDSMDISWNSEEQKKFTKTGAISNAKFASAEKGKEYHEHMVNNIVKLIEWLRVNKKD